MTQLEAVLPPAVEHPDSYALAVKRMQTFYDTTSYDKPLGREETFARTKAESDKLEEDQ